MGNGENGWTWSLPQHAILVIGPPRSGKTSSIVIPAVISCLGPVVSTSTKNEVMESTRHARSETGSCLLFDPTGTVECPRGIERISWSPLDSAGDWDSALASARSMVLSSRPPGSRQDSYHWTERAESLLAPLFHAAAIAELDTRDLIKWVNRREAGEALDILQADNSELAGDLLEGILSTDAREMSGIWSTASGVLAAYRGGSSLESTGQSLRKLDPDRFVNSEDTIYICAPGRKQSLVAPLIVGLLDDIRNFAYSRPGEYALHPLPNSQQVPADGFSSRQILFALDEVANIAPIPDLPSLVSEGGGQGITTLACIQDLSQARTRWGAAADGFFTLFGTKVIFPGIADLRTLEVISTLAGNHQEASKSVNCPAWWSSMKQGTSTTWSLQDKRTLAPDAIARGIPGSALLIESMDRPRHLGLTPYFAGDPWASLTVPTQISHSRNLEDVYGQERDPLDRLAQTPDSELHPELADRGKLNSLGNAWSDQSCEPGFGRSI